MRAQGQCRVATTHKDEHTHTHSLTFTHTHTHTPGISLSNVSTALCKIISSSTSSNSGPPVLGRSPVTPSSVAASLSAAASLTKFITSGSPAHVNHATCSMFVSHVPRLTCLPQWTPTHCHQHQTTHLQHVSHVNTRRHRTKEGKTPA